MTLDPRQYVNHPNVRAFAHVVRHRESSHDDSAYTIMYGGAHFTAPPWAHPCHGITTTKLGRSTACGAYQHLGTTWASIAKRYPEACPDFSPPSQDAGFVVGLIDRGALDSVLEGNLYEAIRRCRQEWTSLPGASEDGGRYTFEEAARVYREYGGALAPVAPAETPNPYDPYAPRPPTPSEPGPIFNPDQQAPDFTTQPQPQGPHMDPISLLAIFGPIIANLIPQVGKLFGGEKDAHNAQVVGAVFDAFTKAATGDPTASGSNVAHVAQAVQAVQADPQLKATVTQAVVTDPAILPLLEVGGGVVKAREHDLATMASDKPFWKASAVFWISVLMLPMVYWLVGSLIVGGVKLPDAAPGWVQMVIAMFGNAWQGETRSGGFNLVIGLILGGICGVYYGVSVTQGRTSGATDKEK